MKRTNKYTILFIPSLILSMITPLIYLGIYLVISNKKIGGVICQRKYLMS